ncbi:MAG: fibronectin type III domain-containing protein, partial [Bacteroidales bacterium]|nr:fibronectin type III domain-containing protein [Bacteroidales bacterium]
MQKHLQKLLLIAAMILLPWVTQGQVFNYTCNFDNDSDTTGWVFMNGSQTNQWFIGSATNNSGTKSLYVSNNNGTSNSYTANITFVYAYQEFTLDSGSYAFSYDWKCEGESTYDYVRVFLAPASLTLTPGQDPTGGTSTSSWSSAAFPTGCISLTGSVTKLNLSSSWQNVSDEFYLPTSGTYRLVFAWANDGSVVHDPAGAIDNIIFQKSTCSRPVNLTLSNLSENSVVVTWSESGSATQWAVKLDTVGGTVSITDVYTTTITYNDLTPNTPYTISVAALCDGADTSMWKRQSFRTFCLPLDSLPYTENFDNISGSSSTSVATNNLPPCWLNHNTGTSTSYSGYPIVYNSSSTAHSGNNAMRFYTYITAGTYSDQIAILPLTDSTLFPLSDIQVNFWMRSTSTSYLSYIVVGVMSNPGDASTFVPVATISTNASTTYEQYTVPFSRYNGPHGCIAFKAPQPTSSYNALLIDDITIEPMPSCPPVMNLATDNPTPNSIDVHWSEMGTAESWYVVYMPTGSSIDTALSTVSYDTTINLTGLYTNTAYTVMVIADCGNETSDTVVTTFRTSCGYLNTLPYTENFDSVAGTTSTSASFNNLPPCWLNHNTGTSTSYSGYPIVYNSSSTAHSGSNAMRFYTYITSGTYSDQIAVMPPTDSTLFPISELQVSFWMRTVSTYNSHVEVGVMTNPADANTFVPVADIPTNASATYVEHTVPLSFYHGPHGYIAFRASQPTTSYNALLIDDITLDLMPFCPPVQNITASNTTDNSIDVSWNEAGHATSWQVIYFPSHTSIDSALSLVTYDTAASLTGLRVNTEYTVYIIADCGSETSDTAVANLRTACGNITTLPFIEDFDGVAGITATSVANNNLPPCWTNHNTGTSSSYSGYPIVYNNSTYSRSGSNAMRFYTYITAGTYSDQIAIMPPTDSTELPLSELQLTFWMRSVTTTYNSFVVVGIMGDPTDAASFAPVDTLYTNNSTIYAEQTVSFNNYTGPHGYIAFKVPQPTTGYNYLYIDDIMLDVIPDCPAVQDLTATNYTESSVDLNWIETGTATSWTVSYLPTGYPADSTITVTAYDTTITLTGLMDNTEYTVIVTANCIGGDGGSSQISFRTACTAITSLPYFYPFEDAEIGSNTNISFAPCLTRLNNGTSYFGYPYVGGSTYNHTYAGSKGLYWYNTTTTGTYGDYQIVVLPAIDTDEFNINTLMFSFWSRASSTSYSPIFEVGVMTDPTDATTFTSISTVNVGNSTAWNEYTVPLGTYNGNGRYVALRATRSTATWYAYVDDFTLEPMPTCPDIDNVTIQSTVSNARISWEYDTLLGFAPASYTIRYGYAADSLVGATTINTAANSIVLSGLTPDTAYTISISAQCGSSTGTVYTRNFYTRALPCLEWDTTGGGSGSSSPEATYIVGTPGTNTTNVMPVNGGNNYSYCNHLILASEINSGAANFSGIDFQYAGTTPMVNTTNCSIYMCHTTMTVCNDFAPVADLQLVYIGDLNCSTSGWNHFEFNHGTFAYNGTSNLIVAIVKNSGTTETSANFYYESKSQSTSHRVYNDNTPYDEIAMGSASAGTSVWRSNMRLTTGGNGGQGDCISSATCAAPAVAVDSVSTTTASISWIPGHTETSWTIEYRLSGTTSWTVVDTAYTSQSYTLTGLSGNTRYEVRVGSSCSDTTYYDLKYFRTECGPVTMLPWSDNLDAYPTGSSSTNSSFIVCWHHLNNGTSYGGYPYVGGSTYNHTPGGSHGLNWYNNTTTTTYGDYQCIVLPELDSSISIDSLQLTFWARASTASYTPIFVIGVMTDPDDISSFVGVDTVPVSLGTTWMPVEAPLNTYTGTGRYIAVKADRSTASWYAYVDDFTIDYAPTCIPPHNVFSTGVTTTSITVDWVDITPATQWQVEYGPSGFTRGSTAGTTLNVYSHPITVTGLDTLSNYDFYIRSICTVGDTSAWYIPTTLTTAMCDNSEIFSIGSSGSTGSTYYSPVNNFYNYTLTETIIDSAEIGGAMDIEYIGYYYNYSSPSTDKTNCTIYFQPTTLSTFSSTSSMVPLNPATAVRVYVGPLNCSQGWNFFPLDTLYHYDGTSNLLVIVDDNSGVYDGSSYVFKSEPCSGSKTIYYYSDSDNPSVTSPSSFSGNMSTASWRPVMQLVSCTGQSCRIPVVTSVVKNYHSATVTWMGEGTSYEVNVKESIASDWPATDIAVTGNTYTFTGLQPATNYTFRIRQDCNADSMGYSEWVEDGFLTDSLPCLTPDSLHAISVTNTTATLDWNVIGTETAWDIHVWFAGFDSVYRVTTR